MGHKDLREPHILLASSNPVKLMRNLSGLVSSHVIKKIDAAVCDQVRMLFELGLAHYDFAVSLPMTEWRQRTSRLYYAAYNCKRAVSLRSSGEFSTDSSDHQKIDKLPDGFPDLATYAQRLKNLRDDRNLADYSHQAQEVHLLIPVIDSELLVKKFIADSKQFLKEKGVSL